MTAPAADSLPPLPPDPPPAPAPPSHEPSEIALSSVIAPRAPDALASPLPASPLPGEPATPSPSSIDTSIPLAAPRKAPPRPIPLTRKSSTTPRLADPPLWPTPEELPGRRWLATLVMLAFISLYAYLLSFYYTGAHSGVDQAGYLMTARLIAGDPNIDNPLSPAQHVDHVEKPAASATDAAPKISPIWARAQDGYTKEHPAPTAVQLTPRLDWLRNRLSFVPESPFQFASRMCIITEPFGPAIPALPAVAATPAVGNHPAAPARDATPSAPAEYRVYAKYPFGYPLLAAIGRDIAGHYDKQTVLVTEPKTIEPKPSPETPPAASTAGPVATNPPAKPLKQEAVGKGFDGMYVVNPLCTVLACFFAYLLFRQAVSPFVAMIGVLWLAFNPLVLSYANDANSHASTLLCVTAGFWGVLSFLRTQQLWRAYVGGLALGYACTIRYSEFLLVLPVTFAAAVNFRPTWKKAACSFALLTAWAAPVIALACVCWISFGSATKTGYTYCNEDVGFGWKYLSGNWGDRTLTGNWETLLTQVNHLGLFIMWPIALAGLFGMLGSAWRLGGVIALWVIPSTLLYLLYYWSPGGDTTTGYLRFFVSVMPGLIFAGVWMLERALATIKGEKYAALIAGTLLAVTLLLIAAFYADGGPAVTDGGLHKFVFGFLAQLPAALWHLMTASKLGLLCAAVIIAAAAGMWLFDRDLIASRMGIALGAGVITALGCAINVSTILPQMDTAFVRYSTLRSTVDNLREILPRGSVIFCDDNMLNQLDCVGGWKLYDTTFFSTAMYQQSKNAVAQRNNPEQQEPFPIQTDRSRFYMELLSESAPAPISPAAAASTAPTLLASTPRSQADIIQLEKAEIDRNIHAGHRVTFLTLADPGDMGGSNAGGASGRITIPTFEGYEKKALRKWTVSPTPSSLIVAASTAKSPPTAPKPAAPRQGATYILYELVPSAAPTAQPR